MKHTGVLGKFLLQLLKLICMHKTKTNTLNFIHLLVGTTKLIKLYEVQPNKLPLGPFKNLTFNKSDILKFSGHL